MSIVRHTLWGRRGAYGDSFRVEFGFARAVYPESVWSQMRDPGEILFRQHQLSSRSVSGDTLPRSRPSRSTPNTGS